MRRRALLCILALVAAACGGDDEGGFTDAAAAVIRSEDGSATLTLPPGVDAEGISVEAIELDGAEWAYELLPSGTTFDEPALLTVTDAGLAPGVGPLVVLVGDDGREAVLDVDVERDGDAATVTVPISHFSKTWSAAYIGDSRTPAYTIEHDAPSDVTVGVPFTMETKVVVSDVVETTVDGNRYSYTFSDKKVEGRFTSVNATPETIADAPPRTAFTSSYTARGTFRCTRPGRVQVHWRFTLRMQVNGQSVIWSSVERDFISCADPTTTTTTTTTRPPTPAARPAVSEIKVELNVPVSTYSVTASVTDGGALTYEWRMVGESCGTPRTPCTQSGRTVTWSHSDQPPDSCQHTGTDHAVTVALTVASTRGTSITCTFEGSESRVLSNPSCT